MKYSEEFQKGVIYSIMFHVGIGNYFIFLDLPSCLIVSTSPNGIAHLEGGFS